MSPNFQKKGGANRRECACWTIFNRKGVLIEWGMHVSQFLIDGVVLINR